MVFFGECLHQQLLRELQKGGRTGQRHKGIQLSSIYTIIQEKYYKHLYPDLFFNRANAESHLEDYQKAIEDFKRADQIDPDLLSMEKIESLRKRLDYIKTCFERSGELKGPKID